MTSEDVRAVVRGILPTIEQKIHAAVGQCLSRLTALEARLEKGLPEGPQGPSGERGPQGERGADGLHGKDGAPGLRGEMGPIGEKGEAGERGPQGEAGPMGPAGRDGRDGVPGAQGQTGEKGLDGANGRDGVDGRHGIDGLGFDDLEGVYDEQGRLYLRFMCGDIVKSFRVISPVDCGVFQEGQTYLRGDSVTWGGSSFVAQKDTTARPESNGDWRLAVKRGRDGREGKAGPEGPRGPRGEKG